MPNAMSSGELEQCIKDCAECARVCAQTAHYSLHWGGEHASPEHQGLLRDCAQICLAAAGFMARSSIFTPRLCRECAEICTACAHDCERFANGDETMEHCANICRQCAQSCHQYAATAE